MHSVETILSFLNFDLFLGSCYAVRSSPAMLGRGRDPQLPVSPAITRVNHLYTDNNSVPRQPFCFSLSEQYSINYMRYSTLYYKIGLVLDYFAQLLVNMCSEHV